jgi:hypothetical protein
MSRYAYDYSLTPARPTGWRSVVTRGVTVATIVAVSAISGAVVTLDLFAQSNPPADTSAVAAATIQPVPARAARLVAPHVADVASAAVTDEQHPVVAAAQPVQQPAAVPAPQPAPVVAVNDSVSAPMAEGDLTFTSGYAQRRAVHEGVSQATNRTAQPATAASVRVARIEAKTQVGRAAIKIKPKVYARANAVQDPRAAQDPRRVADARAETNGVFDRFDRSNPFDFSRHQALAFGDPRTNRRASPPQHGGGTASNSTGGLFGGLF